MANLFVFPLAWVIAFLAPVLPIVARSELYLYLPVFGVCLLAGLLAQALIWNVAQRRTVAVVVAVYVVDIRRLSSGARNQPFTATSCSRRRWSRRFDAARRSRRTKAPRSSWYPQMRTTERFLQDAIGGYLSLVLQHALGSTRLTGDTQYAGAASRQAGLRLLCEYRDGEVRLTTQY